MTALCVAGAQRKTRLICPSIRNLDSEATAAKGDTTKNRPPDGLTTVHLQIRSTHWISSSPRQAVANVGHPATSHRMEFQAVNNPRLTALRERWLTCRHGNSGGACGDDGGEFLTLVAAAPADDGAQTATKRLLHRQPCLNCAPQSWNKKRMGFSERTPSIAGCFSDVCLRKLRLRFGG
jgi:hypothetical protein